MDYDLQVQDFVTLLQVVESFHLFDESILINHQDAASAGTNVAQHDQIDLLIQAIAIFSIHKERILICRHALK